jgi:hypothetical protein
VIVGSLKKNKKVTIIFIITGDIFLFRFSLPRHSRVPRSVPYRAVQNFTIKYLGEFEAAAEFGNILGC